MTGPGADQIGEALAWQAQDNMNSPEMSMSTPSESVGMLVPNDKVPRLIGKQGAGLKQIREASGQKVECKPEDAPSGQEGPGGIPRAATTCRLVLTGSPEQIVIGFDVAIRRTFPEEPQAEVLLRIPPSWAGRAIGRGGENLKRTREELGVKAEVERERAVHPVTFAEERVVSLSGPPDKLAQALSMLIVQGQENGRAQAPWSAPGGGGAPAAGGYAPTLPGMMPMGAIGAAAVPGLTSSASPQARQAIAAVNNALSAGVGNFTAPEEVCLSLTVENSMVGVIIGRGGARINETMAQASCRMKITDRVEGNRERSVIFGGPIENAIAALNAVYSQMAESRSAAGQEEPTNYSVVMILRQEACGSVIGKGGTVINELRRGSGARIKMSDDGAQNLRPCFIDGTIPALQHALRLVHEIVRQVPVADTTIDGAGACAVGAKRPLDGLLPMPGTLPKRRRTEEEENNDPETKLLVPDQTVGLVIGKQGANLKAIREGFSVRMEVLSTERAPHWAGERMVIIKGPTAPRAAALEAVLRLVLQHKSVASESNVSFKLLVPVDKAGSLSWEGGPLKQMNEQLGVHPVIGTEEVLGEHLMIVHGAPSAVLLAAKQIVNVLDGGVFDLNAPSLMLSQQAGADQYALAPAPGYGDRNPTWSTASTATQAAAARGYTTTYAGATSQPQVALSGASGTQYVQYYAAPSPAYIQQYGAQVAPEHQAAGYAAAPEHAAAGYAPALEHAAAGYAPAPEHAAAGYAPAPEYATAGYATAPEQATGYAPAASYAPSASYAPASGYAPAPEHSAAGYAPAGYAPAHTEQSHATGVGQYIDPQAA
eukprot:CAMPEP_0170610316 /NCGR_PEP_ID=MMETSP0224-20130122/22592_1 /TAXON_ID=285029 /ORGANISM="Togula jolla, Strain CCCM 725" /LENGTH=825 /DNA_ID=CAMNT_0010935679 /DNA_START=23 /DNA_END=2496 /DNA_ORIENTATION=-